MSRSYNLEPLSSIEPSPVSHEDNLGSERPTSTALVWTVSQFTRKLRGILEGSFRSVFLSGELSNVKQSPQGHVYFVLKDSTSQIKGVLFRTAFQKIPFELKDGLEVVVRGGVSLYEPRGEYQIQVVSIEPKGIGALQLAFEQLKKTSGRRFF